MVRNSFWYRKLYNETRIFMAINYDELKKFLYNANAHGYAGNSNNAVPAQRPGFLELEYKEEDWLFHDSYAGHYFAPGQEVVYFQGKPVWAMAYAGGMETQYHGDQVTTQTVFIFLKKALRAMDPRNPYRGPASFTEGEWKYFSELTGDVQDFTGNEMIYKGDQIMFQQNFIGGIIV